MEDLSENDHYLWLIFDINTRWNLSYFAWKRLEKIRDCIDVMVITMSRDQDPITRKDGRRLSKINLNEEECDAIKQLIKVLGPFASGSQLLEESKYSLLLI